VLLFGVAKVAAMMAALMQLAAVVRRTKLLDAPLVC
jgi:hypothetical protein